ncbi:Phosphate:acyl-ACP acyltransferase PlsX (EC 2.3.1.n2) [hydrothermal vent metagenome]|uniref:phosphate acyltransferase n=1 Tax=hydrothermal vent metagenome TaxID=652676 RepID=A0A3B1BEE9_9ZZZZ
MTGRITISLDAMGGDYGAEVIVPAALSFLKHDPDVDLVLVGREEVIRQHLNGAEPGGRLRIHPASEEVEMDEHPSKALRNKKDSSMRVAINLVKDGSANACVSAGNTGALMATARFVLKMLPDVDRPAIIAQVPSIDGHTWMLDLGANVDCDAEHLFQFAVMGSGMVSAIEDKVAPRVALLNIGHEEIKGNDQVKLAHELLEKSSLNYIGYVEGDTIYKGGADIVVTDGFVGNVSLKSCEGVATMISHYLKQAFARNLITKFVGLITLPILRHFKRFVDPRRYNGASLLGLRGIVIKSHGGADELAFENAIQCAKDEVLADVPSRIASRVEEQLNPMAAK